MKASEKVNNEKSKKGYFAEDDVQYPQNLQNVQNNLQFLPEWTKIEKFQKVVVNLHDKIEYVIHVRNLNQAVNHRLVFKKVHRVIKFNQKAWRKSYIELNTELRKKAKNDFEKDFFKLMKNSVLERAMETIETTKL